MAKKVSKGDFNLEAVYIWTCPTCKASNHKFNDPIVGAVAHCDSCCEKIEVTE